MNKPDQLRAYLTARIPDLKREPERLKMFIDEGRIVSTASTRGAGMRYDYTLNLLLLDWAEHPDILLWPMLAWLTTHEPALVLSWARGGKESGVPFEADILDSGKVDLSLKIPLSELVVAVPAGDGVNLQHQPEPGEQEHFGPFADPPNPALLKKVFANDELIVEAAP